jgi:hypothetical protein
MRYYCHVDSSGNFNDTNLQLYSLKKAAEEWNDLIDKAKETGIESVDFLKERFVFITNCLGLSLSQLIGQNSPSANRAKMEPLSILFPRLLEGSGADDMTQERLKNMFEDFLTYYNAIRHFGEVKYMVVDELTLDKLNCFRGMTVEIWDLVILKYRMDEENDIEEFSSIGEIVYFEELNNEPSPY